MDKFSISANFRSKASSQLLHVNRRNVNPEVFLDRMERLTQRRKEARAAASISAPQHADAKLLREGAALETAWRYEIAALMIQRRMNTPEMDEIATTARAVTAAVAKRIDAAKARTLDGMKIKARAILWARHGEPLEAEGFESIDREIATDA